MRYKIHPKGRPSAWSWVTPEQYEKIKQHRHGKDMVIAEKDDSPSEFAHVRPILPKEATEKQARKGTTEATPEPVTKKGEHGA